MTGFPLSSRQIRTTLDILTALMVISVAVALAGLTWRIAGHAGTGAITVPGGRGAVSAPVDPGQILALAPFGTAATVAEAGQPTSIAAVLKGVIAAQSPDLAAAFIEVGGQPARPFRVGEGLEGATITGILRDRVLIDNAGRAEFLAFPNLTPGASGPAACTTATAPAAPTAAPAPTRPGGAPGPVPASASVMQAMKRLDARPVANGFAVGSAAPPGMRPGDVIQSINGASLSSPAAAESALAAAVESGQAQVNILRDGKQITITIPLE